MILMGSLVSVAQEREGKAKVVYASVSPDNYSVLLKVCSMEGCTVREKTSELMEEQLERLKQKMEVPENGGKGAKGMDGENRGAAESDTGKHIENPAPSSSPSAIGKISWLPVT